MSSTVPSCKSDRSIVADVDYVYDSRMGVQQFFILSNRGNPISGSTSFGIGLPKTSHVKIVLQNILGDELKTIFEQDLASGVHVVHWLLTDEESGPYFVTMRAGGFVGSVLVVIEK
jgi:hypothetical protein